MKSVFQTTFLTSLAVAGVSFAQTTVSVNDLSMTFDADGVLVDLVVGGVDQVDRLVYALSADGGPVDILDSANFLDITPGTNRVETTHFVGNYDILTTYTLTGAGNSATLNVLVEVLNFEPLTSSDEFDIDLFQLVDLDLNGTAVDASAGLVSPQNAEQRESGVVFSANTINPVTPIDITQFGLASDLFTGVVATGTLDGSTASAGPGDLAFGLGFLDENGFGNDVDRQFQVSSVFSFVVPTPGAAILLGLAGAAGLRRNRG